MFFSFASYTQTNWTLHKKDGAYTIWLKDVPNEKIKQFKLEAIIKGNFEDVHNIMKDVEKMHLWYDKVKSVKLLKKINENDGEFTIEFNAETWAAENLLKQINKQIDIFEAQLT